MGANGSLQREKAARTWFGSLSYCQTQVHTPDKVVVHVGTSGLFFTSIKRRVFGH